jgi:cell wall-associated NlpC family hydrolase
LSGSTHGHHPGSTTTTTTLPIVPAKAEPLLKQLLAAAGLVTADNEKASVLSEDYDQEQARLTKAAAKVAALDAMSQAARYRLTSAKKRLVEAAVKAYVTGEETSVNSPLLSSSASDGEMSVVYAGVATDQLRSAEARYSAIVHTIGSSRDQAAAAEHQISDGVAYVGALKRQAQQLIKQAADQYAAVSHQLLVLVGPKEFARLFSPWPAGALYKGPNLGGTAVGKVGNVLQGLLATATARKFIGVPYLWGGASRKGVDCSGLTMLAWAASGVSLAHSATLQWEESAPVPLDKLQPGDLLFYHFSHDGSTPITHVAMYVGSGPYGTATIVQASQPGTNVSYSPIYFEGLVGAGRP